MWIIQNFVDRFTKIGGLSLVFLSLIFLVYTKMIYDFELINVIYFCAIIYYLKEYIYQRYGL